ncbi:hypothetical protein [Desulfitobacterium chlororespirans]|uniref:PcfK-like protein n=1 Tax=Desulfitobacterium chlororespirans DSM 11544 TaxID=1121395 RepID=A0A1M7UYF7_9FIRM|nr:hypothetical protein [Desulfitobacterium chlororespirans]SHN87972.1 PcfK-like protein [Desulfitobacterium chlororespirans DSM 11544]
MKEVTEKINNEISKNRNNPHIVLVGQFLLNHLQQNPGDAAKILDKNKSISGSMTAMRKEAEKRKVGNCAVFTDQEGFEIVLKYFGIEGKRISLPQTSPVTTEPMTEPKKQSSSFDVKLEDLLS